MKLHTRVSDVPHSPDHPAAWRGAHRHTGIRGACTRGTRVLATGLLAACCSVAATAQEMRLWTTQNGQTVTAALVDVDKGLAVLRREDGVTVRATLDSLSTADRLRATSWLALHKGTGAMTNAGPEVLPVFADGPWKSLHTVYRGRTYDALMDARGRIDLHVKTNDVRVGKPIVIQFGCHYYDPAKQATVARPVVEYAVPPAPQVLARPGSVKLAGLFADGVRFTYTVAFTEKSCTVEGEISDPPRLSLPSNLGYHAQVQRTYTAPPDATFEQIRAQMPDWTLALTPVDGKAQVHPYWKLLKSQHVEQAQVCGPWASRKATILAPTVKVRETQARVNGYFSIYVDMAPYTGFHVGRAGTSAQEAGELSITIE